MVAEVPVMTLMEEGAGSHSHLVGSLIRAVSAREILVVLCQVGTEFTLLDLIESNLVVGNFLGAATISNLVHLRFIDAVVEVLERTALSAWPSNQLSLRVILQIIVVLFCFLFLLVLKLGTLLLHHSTFCLVLNCLIDRSQFTYTIRNKCVSLQ